MKRRLMALIIALSGGLALRADVVHVWTQKSLNGTISAIADITQATGGDYVLASAPSVSGYIFTHWSTSDAQGGLVVRDETGRSYEAAPYHLNRATTFTAHYLPINLDSDGDGVADGSELYWYGDLAYDADSDTDGDGYTFAEEMVAGTNPLMKNILRRGGVIYLDSNEVAYDPHSYATVTIKSEPEGALFSTTTDKHIPGATITTPSIAAGSKFAYWMVNGERQIDGFGRALDSVSFTMADKDVVVVAVCVNDATERQKLYWYGTTEISLDSDSDGDGYTFAEEMAAGTNPLMKNISRRGGVIYLDSNEEEVNLQPSANIQTIVIGNVAMTVNNNWLDEQIGAGFKLMTEDEVIEELTTMRTEGNGLPLLDCYVLGLNPKDAKSKPFINNRKASAAGKLALGLDNVKVNTESGVVVKFTLKESDDTSNFKAVGSAQVTAEFEIDLPNDKVKYYKIEYSFE